MSKRRHINDILFVIIGNFILACGVVFFIIPNSILSGGVAGLAVALQPLFDVDPNLIIMIMTGVLFLLGMFFLGKGFTIKTGLSTILYPGFIAILSFLTKDMTITENSLLASIYGGAFMGIGVGLVFRSGASTGGMDIPPMIINKYTHIPLSKLVLITDALTVMVGLTIYGVEPAMIGLVSVWVCAYMIDKTMMLGSLDAKSIMIISDRYEEILEEVTRELDRGATLIEASGAYTREPRPLVMIVISRKQFPALNRILKELDPGAFVIVSDVNEVHGEGFTFEGE